MKHPVMKTVKNTFLFVENTKKKFIKYSVIIVRFKKKIVLCFLIINVKRLFHETEDEDTCDSKEINLLKKQLRHQTNIFSLSNSKYKYLF